MPVLRVVQLILDRPLADRKIKELRRLNDEGLLRDWEQGYAVEIEKLPQGTLLSVRRAVKILEILQERSKIFSVDGENVRDAITFFRNNIKLLNVDDRSFVENFYHQGRDYAHLNEVDDIHDVANKLDYYFPRFDRIRYKLSSNEISEVEYLVRYEIQLRKIAKNQPKFDGGRATVVHGQRGCGNDLTTLLENLKTLELAVMKSATS